MSGMYPNVPDLMERKGSLFLRSDHMNYSRATLNSTWHQARQAEPKDNDINKTPIRDLSLSTYHRIGNVTDGSLPNTTYNDFTEQVFNQKRAYAEQEVPTPLVNKDTHVDLHRDTGAPAKGFGASLPSHHPDHGKFYDETTHKADYKAPYGFVPAEEKPSEFEDYTEAYKKCLSQFTDTANHRRHGRNTFTDESGVYTNQYHRQGCPSYRKTEIFLE